MHVLVSIAAVIKVSFKAGTSGNADISKQTLGFISGFGFEHKWHAVVAGIEYSYAMGRKIKGNLVGASRSTSLEAQRKSHEAQFRVSYAF